MRDGKRSSPKKFLHCIIDCTQRKEVFDKSYASISHLFQQPAFQGHRDGTTYQVQAKHVSFSRYPSPSHDERQPLVSTSNQSLPFPPRSSSSQKRHTYPSARQNQKIPSIIQAIPSAIHDAGKSHETSIGITIDTSAPFEEMGLFDTCFQEGADFSTDGSTVVVDFDIALMLALVLEEVTSSSPGRVIAVTNSGGSAEDMSDVLDSFVLVVDAFAFLTGGASRMFSEWRFLLSSEDVASWRALRGAGVVLVTAFGISFIVVFESTKMMLECFC
jgi:hypothetical protein